MNKHLQAELWEIQTILFLILATQVHWKWAQIALIAWSVITFVGIIVMKTEAKIKDETL